MPETRSFLVQWEADSHKWIGKPLTKSVGTQMKGLAKGDQIFVSTCDEKEIYLLGAMRVSKVGYERKGSHEQPFAVGDTLVGPITSLPLGGIKWQLKFESTTATKLSPSKSLPWQVRARRRLTPSSAETLLTALRKGGGDNGRTLRWALEEIASQISPIQLRLLEAHFLAPDFTATAEELALAAGSNDSKVTNLHYGMLGTKIRNVLGKPTGPGQQQSSILASFQRPDASNGFNHWRWIMRPEMASALIDLGWFKEDDTGTDDPKIPDPGGLEGEMQRRLVNHRRREASLRRAKLKASRDAHPLRRLVCEVRGCRFDFETKYGQLGEDFAEVHHLRPLGDMDGPVMTRLADLAVVCANCHRMIHRWGDSRALDTIIPNHRSNK